MCFAQRGPDILATQTLDMVVTQPTATDMMDQLTMELSRRHIKKRTINHQPTIHPMKVMRAIIMAIIHQLGKK
jgi:hypothetical protein